MTMRDIGVDVKPPKGDWDGDENCPFYGTLRLRGQVLEGTVASLGMQRTIVIERNNVRYMKKYDDMRREQVLFQLICQVVSAMLKSVTE